MCSVPAFVFFFFNEKSLLRFVTTESLVAGYKLPVIRVVSASGNECHVGPVCKSKMYKALRLASGLVV
jgi:hypothetical protein